TRFGLPVDDAADARPVNCARAHRARLGRRVERARGEEFRLVVLRRPRGEQALGMCGHIPAFAPESVALLMENLSRWIDQDRAEGMVAAGACGPRDGEGAAQERLMRQMRGGHAADGCDELVQAGAV